MENCKNCGRNVGELETPFIWKSQVVCENCYKLLSDQSLANIPTATVVRLPPPPNSTNPAHSGTIVTTERTAKKWKGYQPAGCLMSILGVALMFSGGGAKVSGESGIAAFLFMGGVILFIGGRVGGWWYHG